MCGVVGCGLAPGSAPLQRCFVSGGLSVSLGLRRGGRAGGISSGFSMSVSGRDGVAPPGRRQFAALVLGGIRLGMAILGSRWFVELEVSPSWLGVCWWILLPRQWVVGWSTQVVGARAQCPTRVRSSMSVKEWSSMPLQWPLAMLPHCGPQIRSLCSDILSWFLSKLIGSDSFGRVVVLVSLTATSSVRSSLASQHLTGLFELHVVVVSGPNKCSVLLLRVGKVAAVAVSSCRLVLRSSRRAVLRWAIIFKSGFIGEAKITGFRLSVEFGSSFCGKLLVRIGRASRLRC
ncbi:hypothetical protein F2Q70_00043059 [Brassica cretica]|uniref:Uncharacterized protein n=1 Tax=Brassica cretica TaxID=69181 RepID=A0A8S9KJ85_BRACR|nr:hypothetical protein F2Q70_00043059 [Brassica cretica]